MADERWAKVKDTSSPPAYRSPWGRQIGGASRQVSLYQQAGYRSFLWFGGAGGDKPDPIGDYADRCSMLAFWIGGARRSTYYRRIEGPVGPEGPPFAKHHEREKRHPIDDEEIFEFLQVWTTWNDIE